MTHYPSEPADILEAAADLLSPEGAWIQGSSMHVTGDGQAHYCLVGAINSVAGSWQPYMDTCLHSRNASKAASIAADFLNSGFLVDSLVDWNDDAERTQEEVVDLLKRAAKDLRNQGSTA